MKIPLILVFVLAILSSAAAQNVGINTDSPQAKLHVFGEGMVPEPGGLFMFGNKDAAHLLGDVNYLQSKWTDDGTTLDMYLQPEGGDVGIQLPFNYYPSAPLHVYGPGQSNMASGLLMLGAPDAGNLQIDYDRLQAMDDETPQKLHLQPDGGDVDMADGTLVVDHSAGTVGIGDLNPDASLDIISGGNTSATRALQIRSSTFGNLFNVRNDGHVGIGTSAPNYPLHVIGDIGLTSKVVHSNDDDTYMRLWTDKVTFNVGGKEMIDFTENDSQDVMYLGDGSDVDIRLNNTAIFVNGASDWVGLGTTTPDSKLDVIGDITLSENIKHSNDSDTYQRFTTDRIRYYAGGVLMLDVYEGASDYVGIADGTMYVSRTEDAVGIGTASPQSELHVNHGLDGGITLENTLDNTWKLHNDVPTNNLYLYYNGNVRGNFSDTDGDYTSTSDRRVKKNITDMGPVLDKVNQLSPKTYHFKTQDDDEDQNIGLIAQEVEEVFPLAVSYDEKRDLYGLDYNDFGVISIQAIKELTEIVKAQQLQIDELQAALARVELASANNTQTTNARVAD